MEYLATIIAAHDISGVGRCSLTTALAVLPALGHTCWPLPTAVLSQQTGFEGYSYLDFTPHMPQYISAWQKLEVKADIIYTGFLGNGKQAELLSDFIAQHPESTVVVDPVMGDNAKLYSCFDHEFVNHMRKLAKCANILLPNITEFNLLVGRSGMQEFPQNAQEQLALSADIDAPNLQYIVVTSVVGKDGMCNLLLDVKNQTATEIKCQNSGESFSGSGDLFASVLCGLIACGMQIAEAVKISADFVSKSVSSMPKKSDTRYGIHFEPLLSEFSVKYSSTCEGGNL